MNLAAANRPSANVNTSLPPDLLPTVTPFMHRPPTSSVNGARRQPGRPRTARAPTSTPHCLL